MQIHRRRFLQLMGAGVIAAQTSTIGEVLAAAPAPAFQPPLSSERDSVVHVINRLTFGPTPDLVSHVRAIGPQAFIEAQLNFEQINDSTTDERLSAFDLLALSPIEIFEQTEQQRGHIVQQIVGSTLIRALYSPRQLHERLVQFWSDHFNIFLRKGPVLFLKIGDDREVIRPYAMADFRTLLGASAHSPAMLAYLDNAQSERSAPNENYARELLELHTLGVNGGYSEEDVQAVARAFTGWSIVPPAPRRFQFAREPGTFLFRPRLHDNNEQTILGHVIPSGTGEQAGEMVLDILAAHPATARFISQKLVRRFVADDPPTRLVDACAETFRDTSGDIRQVLSVIFDSDEFWNAPPKFKRPLEYSLSLLRALNYQVNNSRAFSRVMIGALTQLGQLPFHHPAPDGYPDVQSAWSDNLLPRWNAALTVIGGRIPGANADADSLFEFLQDEIVVPEPQSALMHLADYLYGRPLTNAENDIMQAFIAALSDEPEQQLMNGIGLLLAAPAFQYR